MGRMESAVMGQDKSALSKKVNSTTNTFLSFFLLRQNHKQDCEKNQGDAEGDVEREGFMEDQRPDDDGRQRLKNAEDGGLGGTNCLA